MRIILYLILISNILLYAQSNSGAISQDMLKTFDKKLVMDEYTTAMINAVTNNKIKDLALNRALVDKVDHLFDYTIKTPHINDQKQSGRCWLLRH